MKVYQVPQPHREVKPIRYWEAHIQTNFSGKTQCIDSNNSISLLRHKYGNTVYYKAIR